MPIIDDALAHDLADALRQPAARQAEAGGMRLRAKRLPRQAAAVGRGARDAGRRHDQLGLRAVQHVSRRR